MLPVQQPAARRIRSGQRQRCQTAWPGVLLLLLLVVAGLLYVRLHRAGRARVLTAQVQESQRQADSLLKIIDAQRSSLTQLEQKVQHLQQRFSSFNTCLLPDSAVWRPLPPAGHLRVQQQHKAAVLVPYRAREQQLASFLPQLVSFLKAQGRLFDVFVIQQSEGLLFNRGALLNAGVLLLQASTYDYFVFHDVDTIPSEAGNIPYEFPGGLVPLHLTPYEIHPKGIRYEDFFGGIVAFSMEQITAVNGFGTNFWGWGREDDNMRGRLQKLGRWPPQKPDIDYHKGRRYYYKHASHAKAPEVRVRGWEGTGAPEYFAVNPDKPFKDSKIVSSQPEFLLDFQTGLNTTAFNIVSVQPIAELAVKYTVELYCNKSMTPWCVGK